MRLLSIPIFVCTLALVIAPPALARPDAPVRRVDVNGTIVAGGDPVTVTIPSNENALITFTGSANQRVSLALSGVSISMGWASIRKPDGSDLVSPTVFFTSGKFVDAATLPTNGTYTIFVDPYGSYSGSVTLALFDVPADAGGPITAGGDPATATTGTPGQNGRFTFSGTAGQQVSLKATGSNMTGQGAVVSILKPDGSTLTTSNPYFVTNGAMRFLDTATLPSTGTYTVLLDFYEHATGSGTVTLYDVPADISGSTTPTPEGTSTTVNPATPGQDARYTFSGTAGQRVSLMSTGSGLQPTGKGVFVSILKPDGSTLVTSYPFLLMDTVPRFLDATVLPSSGTYTVRIDPWEETTGSATFKVYDVPPDLDDVLAIDGDAFTATTTVPGQDARLPFAGLQGQQITLYRQDVTVPTSIVQILKPDGSVLSSSGAVGTPDGSQTTTLPADGTYTIRVDGFNEAVGDITLYLDPAPTIDPSVFEDANDFVTFRNADGKWTIYKRCVASRDTEGVGPAYISVYETPEEVTAVEGVGREGEGEFTDPSEGGLGIFGFFLARGDPPWTANRSWNISLRRCGHDSGEFGVNSWSTPSYGVNVNANYAWYNQDVWLGDEWTNEMIQVKYRWRFESSGIKLSASVVENCPNGLCGTSDPNDNPGPAYIKAPQFVANITRAVPSDAYPKANHVSTFGNGKWLGKCGNLPEADQRNCLNEPAYECSWVPEDVPQKSTGKCHHYTRTRVRIDFDRETTRGNCVPPAGQCFNIVARSREIISGEEPGGLVTAWESTAPVGLDYWSRAAAQRVAAGEDGCPLRGVLTTNVADGRARNWEYGAYPDAQRRLNNVSIGFKAWDGCQTIADAPAFFRRLGTGSYAIFMSFSRNGGWKTN